MQAYNLNSSIAIFQGLLNSLETAVSRKLMAASMFYYYSAEYKKIKRITWILLELIQNALISQEVFRDYQINLGNIANLNSSF